MKTICSRLARIVVLVALILAGGMAQVAGTFFQVRKIDGRWWLIDPGGHRFLSKGVDTIQFAADTARGTNRAPYGEANQAKYGSQEAWRQAAAKRLIGWGFNTLGAWSDEELALVRTNRQHLAYVSLLDLGATYAGQNAAGKSLSQHGAFPDVFDPEFAKTARRIAFERCTPRKKDPWLVGWFTDNELRWGRDWRGNDELLTLFLALPADAPGHKAAVALLRKRHASIADFNRVWKTSFASWRELNAADSIKPPMLLAPFWLSNPANERKANEADPNRAVFIADCEAFVANLAEQYFSITSAAVRAADRNHLVLGCRFAHPPQWPSVIAAAAKHLDVISFNCYVPDPRLFIDIYSAFDKPVLIGEFAFRGADVGLPNSKGGGPVVKTQADRAAGYARYVTRALSKPNLIGYHWFEHTDEPKEGRFDGEDCNYGVVNVHDEPYQALTEAMPQLNAQAEKLHEQAIVKEPDALLQPAKWRTWTDSAGTHEVEAKFSGMALGKVKLTKRNGTTVQVPLEKLSEADLSWIKNNNPERSEGKANSE